MVRVASAPHQSSGGSSALDRLPANSMPVLLDLVMNGPPADAEQLGRILLDPARLLQGPEDGVFLALLQGEGISCRRGPRVDFRQTRILEVNGMKDTVPTEHGSGFQGVFQLPDVSPATGIRRAT